MWWLWSFYTGQTGKGFQKCFFEHTPKYNLKGQTTLSNIKSNYAHHLNENHKNMSFNSNLKPIYVFNKGAYINALGEFEIYREHNDVHSVDFMVKWPFKLQMKPILWYRNKLVYTIITNRWCPTSPTRVHTHITRICVELFLVLHNDLTLSESF